MTDRTNYMADVKMGSERGFGMVFAGVFSIMAAWPLLRGHGINWAAYVPAAAFLLAALLRPGMLAPLNRAWFKFGLALSRITTPLVMGALFFGVVVPTGLVMRLRRKDLLKLTID